MPVGVAGTIACVFEALADPTALAGILDVHVLDADRATIGCPCRGEHFRHRRQLEPEGVVAVDATIIVLPGKAMGLRMEVFVGLGLC